MVKSSRLIDIWLYINNHKKITTTELATKFNVSTRTIQRDIDELSLLGVPFYSEVGRNGGYTMLHQEVLPPISFSEDEIISIILTYKSMIQYKDFPYQFEIESVIAKLLSNSSTSLLERLSQVEKCFYLKIPVRNEKTPYLKEVFNASIKNKCVEVMYDSLENKNKKLLFPIGIYSDNGYWYFCAIDNHLKEVRTYRVDRIKSLVTNDTIQCDKNRLTIEDAFANQVQSNEGNKQLVRMRINKKALRILNTPILDFAKVKWDKDDFWGVYEDFFSLDEMEYLSSLLTIYGDNIKVTEPKSMIEKIQRHLAKITNLYE
ncbi:helix-turn-helix transcriptional regulator [Streptococcus agalactiae]|uniref:helix-turn-helix transcriptional regulator n=1 Tax=Streptococcus agalactiae TaxID=1311 RepID=UPI003D7EEAEE